MKTRIVLTATKLLYRPNKNIKYPKSKKNNYLVWKAILQQYIHSKVDSEIITKVFKQSDRKHKPFKFNSTRASLRDRETPVCGRGKALSGPESRDR